MAVATAPRALVHRLVEIAGADAVFFRPEDLLLFEYDGTIDRGAPAVVVYPSTAEQVAAIVRLARAYDLPLVPRGAGTGLSGGALATEGGILMPMMRMNRLLDLDVENRIAVVEPGLVNLELSRLVAKHDLFYAPDPSSQKACTIGGNVAENAGGPHCLALGVTTNHVLGVEVVTAAGEVHWLGGEVAETPGYDLRGAFGEDVEIVVCGYTHEPMVETHQGILFVNPAHTHGFDGMERDSGWRFVEELSAHAVQERFVYRHRWRVGDVVMWDELATMHRGAGDSRPEERRVMMRSIVYPT